MHEPMHSRAVVAEVTRRPSAARAAGKKPREMVLNIDIAPTVLDIAGVKAPTAMHGDERRSAGRRDTQ